MSVNSSSASSSSSTAPSTASGATVSTNTIPIPETTKRKLDELTASFSAMVAKKKRRRSPKATKTTAEKLEDIGKFFVRAVNPYMDIGDALQYGCERRWGTPAAVDASNTVRIPASEHARQDACVAAFNAMFRNTEDMLDVVKHLFLQISEDDTENWDKLVTTLRSAATTARTGDTSGLKHCTHYVLPDARGQALLPAVHKSEEKSDRGLSHPILRYFILGWADRLKLPPLVIPTAPRKTATTGQHAATVVSDTNPSVLPPNGSDPEQDPAPVPNTFLQRIVAGTVELTAADFPSFFWAEGSYDPEDLDNGLLRGHLLLRVFRHIWTAPTSALNGLDKGIPAVCNARVHAKYSVEPEMVGYACAQARTILSTKQWDVRDSAYNYERMFNAVVKLFSGLPDDPWALETLEWYQDNVFGDADIPSADAEDAVPIPSAADDILAQRAVRAAERAQRASECSVPSLYSNSNLIHLFDFIANTATLFYIDMSVTPLSAPSEGLMMIMTHNCNTWSDVVSPLVVSKRPRMLTVIVLYFDLYILWT
ncbi:hypothetical protein DFH07DRAFT_968430 [Mycena maculata]|uniref:Uncharacterized protein n=1 Tax=Mycena maculata TaxID=230809 RepID=A0AAD7MUC2_9AGAR|nr:hypothetical protein DFH07DRAFT_968430 [Mycena maculata]